MSTSEQSSRQKTLANPISAIESNRDILTVFFESLNEIEILEVAKCNMQHVLFSFKPSLNYQSSTAKALYWQRHLCGIPEFRHYLDLTNSTGYYSRLEDTTLKTTNCSIRDDKGFETIFTEQSHHLKGLFQLLFVLAEINYSSIALVIGDSLCGANITGLSSTNLASLLALLLNQRGKKTCVIKGNEPAIEFLKQGGKREVTIIDNTYSQYCSRLEIEQQQDDYSDYQIALDLSYIRNPQQYYNALSSAVSTNKHLLFYNCLAQVWGNLNLFPLAKVVRYTYQKHEISEELSATCASIAEKITFEFGYCSNPLLHSYAQQVEKVLPQFLVPNIASWLIGKGQIQKLKNHGFKPANVISANVYSVISSCLRSELENSTIYAALPHSFTNAAKDGLYFHTSVIDCPRQKVNNKETLLRQSDRSLPESMYLLSNMLCLPIKFKSHLSSGYKKLKTYAHEKKSDKLRIAIFLNADWFFGYWITVPQQYVAYLQQVAARLSLEDIPFEFNIICKGVEQTPLILESLLERYIQNNQYKFIESSGGLSLSKNEWFEKLDISLFIGHGSINVEAAIECLPTYVFDAEFQLFSPLQWNYTEIDIKPRVIQRSDKGQLGRIFCSNEIALEAARQCHHVLSQTNLLRKSSPQLLR